MNGQSSFILSAEGKNDNQRKEMSRVVNVANMVISHRMGLPEDLYSCIVEQKQICRNKLMDVPVNDSLELRILSC